MPLAARGRFFSAAVALVAHASLPHSAAGFLRAGAGAARSFQDYIRTHQRQYAPDTEEFELRQALFERARRFVERHNSRSGRSWTAGLTQLADRTDAELASLRGYRREARPGGSFRAAGGGLGLLASRGGAAGRGGALPEAFSWKGRLAATKEVQNQGGCGSCWAVSSSTVLRAHAELFQKDLSFSADQILSCTENPRECGGTGGCDGATAELAMNYVSQYGCVSSNDWEYDGLESPDRCFAAESQFQTTSAAVGAPPAMHFGMRGYSKLQENALMPIMLAVVQKGPVVVSLAAGAEWNLYLGGIMDACPRDAVIDHAVVLVGFGVGQGGTEEGLKYWHIQNSWGPLWGEDGFVRLARHSDPVEAGYCGTDNNPQVGSGCKGGPSQVEICGTCGILYDVVMPEFDLGPTGLWSSDAFVESLRNATHDAPAPLAPTPS